MSSSSFPGTPWFEHISIRVSHRASHDDPILATDGSRVKSAVYKITVTHRPSNMRVHLKRTDFDFEKLRDDATAALNHGHMCEASCPWFFVDLVEHIPKRRFLLPNHADCVVAHHIRLYQELFDHTRAYILSGESKDCLISRDIIPGLLFEFLLRDQVQLDKAFLDTPKSPQQLAKEKRGRRSYRLEKSKSLSLCRVCGDGLVAEDVAAPAYGGGLSTLPCHHVFHDECILLALQDTLECPTCRDEAASLLLVATVENEAGRFHWLRAWWGSCLAV
ncbi:Aste57867_13447 [Aphanomyces stellatus]|uniref:Aste57867_13447 protein n=1 Tax=Aphanomyces stellatus TaxID=120398 RepID=A0A485KYN8_9STRA|nr:hypothetical protein As57867_013397 [Aphanomyces stellatus]VFT90285.1 Aste57867_13447 [Aphanomyces stellatus]